MFADATNKAQNAKMKAAIDSVLSQKSLNPAAKQAERNSVKGVLDVFGIDRNQFYYQLRKHESKNDSNDDVPELLSCSGRALDSPASASGRGDSSTNAGIK